MSGGGGIAGTTKLRSSTSSVGVLGDPLSGIATEKYAMFAVEELTCSSVSSLVTAVLLSLCTTLPCGS